MADPNQRVIVDALNWRELYRFPRILSAVTMAMRPAQLAIGLLILAALLTAGRLWDSFTPANVSPDGLHAGQVASEVSQAAWKFELERFEASVPEAEEDLEFENVVEALRNQYRAMRDKIVSGDEAESGLDEEGAEAARDAELTVLDTRYMKAISHVRDVRPLGVFEATERAVSLSFKRIVQGVIHLNPAEIFSGFNGLLIQLPSDLWRNHKAFVIVYGLIMLLIIAIGGGALSRMSACHFAGQERLAARAAFDFSLANWFKLISAQALPLVIAGVIALIMMIIGLIAAIPLLDVIAGVLYGLVYLLGFLLAFVLIGYAAGFSLLVPAVACENCDPVDAHQRAYSYVIARPLHYVAYVIIGLIGLALGYVVVAFFASSIVNATASLLGAWNDHAALDAAGSFAVFDLSSDSFDLARASSGRVSLVASLISFWQMVVAMIVGGYVWALIFNTWTIIYLLMRKHCDGQDLSLIWQPGMIPGTLSPIPSVVESPMADDELLDDDDVDAEDNEPSTEG